MKVEDKTKEQLVKELKALRQRVAELEKSEVKHKQEQKRLKESNIQLSSIFSSLADLVFVFDKETRFTSFYVPGEKLYVTPEKFIRKKHSEVMPSYVNELFTKAFDENKQGKVAEYEYWLDVDGETKWYSAKLSPLLLDGDFLGSVAVIKNVTEHKKTEEALKESEERLLYISNFIPDVIIVLDEDGRYIDIITGKEDLLYKEKDKIIGLLLHDVLPKNVADAGLKAIQQSIKAHKTQTIEYQLTVLAGKKWFEGRISSVPSTIWKKKLVVMVARDITEHKQMEGQLRKTTTEYLAAINMTGDIIIRLDRDGRRTLVNDRACQFFGLSREELLNGKFGDHIYPDDVASSFQVVDDMIRTGKPVHGFVNCQLTPQGIRIVEWNIYPFYDEDSRYYGWQATGRDITEKKQFEEELKQHRDHLEELVEKRTAELAKTNKQLRAQMEQRIKFTRALVHELKTPLTPLIGASDILVDKLQGEELRRIAKNINRGANNLNNRINDLINLAKGEMGLLEIHCRPIDLLQMLCEIVDYIKPVADRKKQVIMLDLPASLPITYADEDRLRQVVLNLLNNALKFTPAKGEINIKAETKDSSLIVHIADTGCGITEKDQKWLFKLYRTKKEPKEQLGGLGIGLPLSKMLVELHGGKIWVKSGKGMGSTFSFSIPIKANK